MKGKEYVEQALEKAGRALQILEGRGVRVEGLKKALEDLQRLKGRPTLRTKAGAHLAVPVSEAALRLEEALEEPSELEEALEEFEESVRRLEGALKERTVIMT